MSDRFGTLCIKGLKTLFLKNRFFLSVFIDLSTAFDTADHYTLLIKLKEYRIKGHNLRWFESYLKNRKLYIKYDNKNIAFADIICGVPQGSVLGASLFLIYIIDLWNVSKFLDLIVFADDTNLLFFEQRNHNAVLIVNIEREKVSFWLIFNKLSLNVKKDEVHFIP